jgi:hypothetical protein
MEQTNLRTTGAISSQREKAAVKNSTEKALLDAKI